jgi:cytoskeletal protein RodZ
MSEEEFEKNEEEEEKEEEKSSKKKKGMSPLQKKLLLIVLAIIIIAGASSYLTFSYIKTNPEPFGLLKGPSIIKSEEKALVAEISKSLTLPKDEEPTVATVTDPEKLSSQFFFKDAQKGDKLLIYQNAKKVILYRPSENRVVEVGMVNINGQAALTPSAQSYRMAILNSTKDTGITSSMETKIQQTDNAVQITEKGTSVLTYNESFLVDVKGDKSSEAQKLIQGLGIKTGNLPDAERKIDVDFILIIGADKI